MAVLTAADLAALHRLGRLSPEARRAVEGVLGGRHRSRRRGFAIEFAGHREYQPGDDLRHLDWQVWARSDRYEIRQHDEESRLQVMVVCDVSGSLAYAGRDRRAKALAGALAWLAAQRRDAVGMAAIGDGIRWLIPPGVGMGHLLRMLAALDEEPCAGVCHLGRGLEALTARLGRRGVVIAVSDALEEPAAIGGGLRLLRHRRQDVRLAVLRHADEEAFALHGALTLVGLEGEGALQVDADRVRGAYLAAVRRQRRALAGVCAQAQARLVWCRSDEDLAAQVARCLEPGG